MISAERDLLFGLVALQVGLIDQDQLVSAFRAWVGDRTRPLAGYLDGLDPDQRDGVEGLVTLHLKKYGGDVARSLAAIGAGRSTRLRLAELGDAQLDATLTYVGSGASGPFDVPTATEGIGAVTAEGRRFRVLRPHARGGLGAVYVALDEELHREVALKQILEHHADDPISRQRFLVEAEITGGLEHPGIVPVYGLGHHRDGRPYYAMRFIKGASLKEAITVFHADEALKDDPGARALALRKLLRRFLDVCNAIDYAHGRGVLHRDLKPANVIVGKHGETLVVDWGLAKAVGQGEVGVEVLDRPLVPSSASGSDQTLPGSVLGTPAYMSPEQAAGDLERLGPASDVYSLGATLYSLLTGRPPFQEGHVAAVLQAVRVGDFRPPRALERSVPRPLEAICLKAMATRPEDRYPTPRALAEDIERWMADEPVNAHREGFWERLTRWSRTHRTLVRAAAASLVVALMAAALIAVQQHWAVQREQRIADRERQARIAEQKALTIARTRLGQLERANDLLASIFRDLSPNAEQAGKPLRVQLGERLDQAANQLDAEAIGDPVTVARLQGTLGRTQLNLDRADKAILFLSRASDSLARLLAPDHPETLTSRNNLARAYLAAGRTAEAIPMIQEIHKLRFAKIGPDHLDTLVSLSTLASAYLEAGRTVEAIPLFEDVLRRRTARLGPDHADTLTTRNNLASVYSEAGRTAEAIALHEGTLKLRMARLGPDHVDTGATRVNLSVAYLKAGRPAEAIPLLVETLAQFTARLGPDHNDTHSSRNNLAEAYQMAGRANDAVPLHRETLKLRTARLGPDHPTTLASRSNLGGAYMSAGRTAEAIPLFEETLRLSLAKLGPDHPNTLTIQNNLANAYNTAGRPAEAIPLDQEVLRRRTAKLGPDHPETLASRNNLARGYFTAGRTAEAIALWEGMLKALAAKLGPDHPNTLATRSNLAAAYVRAGRTAEAIPLFESSYRFLERRLGTGHPLTLTVSGHLAGAYFATRRWAQSEALYQAGLEHHRQAGPSGTIALASDLATIGLIRMKQGRWTEAEPVLRESLEIRKHVTPDDWSRFRVASLLGAVLLGQGKYAEAEPLVIDGYAGLKARSATVALSGPDDLIEAAERIVRLYESWGKLEKAADWKRKLGLADLPANVFARP